MLTKAENFFMQAAKQEVEEGALNWIELFV